MESKFVRFLDLVVDTMTFIGIGVWIALALLPWLHRLAALVP